MNTGKAILGIFAGIAVGLTGVWLYNKYCPKSTPSAPDKQEDSTSGGGGVSASARMADIPVVPVPVIVYPATAIRNVGYIQKIIPAKNVGFERVIDHKPTRNLPPSQKPETLTATRK